MAQHIWGDTPDPMSKLDCVIEDQSWTRLLPQDSVIVYNKGHGASLWSQAAKISVRLPDGAIRSYFIKLSKANIGKLMAEGEYYSMAQLHQYGPDITPRPAGWGSFVIDPDLHFFMCDFVDITHDILPFPSDICAQVAEMHIKSQHVPDNPGLFGFEHVTCNGTVLQHNKWNVSWEAFFLDKLQDLFLQDESVHGTCKEYDKLKPALFDKVVPRLLRPLETGGNKIIPALCHGDLWHLNAASQVEPGRPAMIYDPSSFWAHNEYDLYEWDSPRYLFDRSYVDEYRRHLPPSAPAEDVDDRLALYTIVAELVSSILYPKSTRYRTWAIEKATKLVDKYPHGYTGSCGRKGEDKASMESTKVVVDNGLEGGTHVSRVDSIVA